MASVRESSEPCSVAGCDRKSMYKAAQLCQKHYFRKWRNGTTNIVRKARQKLRVETPNGYIRVYKPDHPIAYKDGFIFEHRFVMYGLIGATGLSCALCGKPESWSTCHVDHINNDTRDNRAENLRVACRGCNVKRGHATSDRSRYGKSIHNLEFEGETKTAKQWSEDPRVSIAANVIVYRMGRGWSHYDCLFHPKITHNGLAKS